MTTRSKVFVVLSLILVGGGAFAAGRFLVVENQTAAAGEEATACEAMSRFDGIIEARLRGYDIAQRHFDRHDTPADRRVALDILATDLGERVDQLRGLRYDLLVNHDQPLAADLHALAEAARQWALAMQAESDYWRGAGVNSLRTVTPPTGNLLRLPEDYDPTGLDWDLISVLRVRC